MEKTNNTIRGRHILRAHKEPSHFYLGTKEYCWHIPKAIRGLELKKGDCVLARSKDRLVPVYVTDVFREDIEETGLEYNCVEWRVDWGRGPIDTSSLEPPNI